MARVMNDVPRCEAAAAVIEELMELAGALELLTGR